MKYFLILTSLTVSSQFASANGEAPLCTTGDYSGYVTLYVGASSSGRFHIDTVQGAKELFETIDGFAELQMCMTANPAKPQCSTRDFSNGHVTLYVGSDANGRYHIDTIAGREMLFQTLQEFQKRQMCVASEPKDRPEISTRDFSNGHVTLYVGDEPNGRFHVETEGGRKLLFSTVKAFMDAGLAKPKASFTQ